jgi:hypothetical protein
MSEDKVRTKDLCWSVGMIYGSREMPEVSITGPDSVELNARLPCAVLGLVYIV